MGEDGSVSTAMAQQPSSLSKGLSWGLILGLAASATTLVFLGWRTANQVCEFPDTEECVFETTMYGDIARLEVLGGLGVALVAAGLYLYQRRRPA